MAASTAEPPPDKTSRATSTARGSSAATAPANPPTAPLPISTGPGSELPQPCPTNRTSEKRNSCGQKTKDLALWANPSKADMRKQLISLLAAAAVAATPLLPLPEARADDTPSLVRDAEIETTIRAYATPIFTAAGLDPQLIHVYLLQSDQINAFVAGGMNLFIYTGLLIKTERPNQLVGVIAHETGHIAGGHLARFQEALSGATIESVIGMVLGGIAAAASR